MPFTFSCDALNCRSSMYEYPKLLEVIYKWVRCITELFPAIMFREHRNVSIHVTYGPNIRYNYV